MKYISSTIVLCCLSLLLRAQGTANNSVIPLSVVGIDKLNPDLNEAQMNMLQTRIINLVSSGDGLAAVDYSTNFLVYARISIYETNVAETGMQNIYLVTSEVSLFIKQLNDTNNRLGSNLIFSTVSKQIKGSGASKVDAITNIISKISYSDNEFKKFIQTGKSKIIDYYNNSCGDIQTMAENLAHEHNYKQALTLLMTVPIEARDCYNRVQDKATGIYASYVNSQCNQWVQIAKTRLAVNDIDSALVILAQIDPSSVCGDEASKLIKKTEGKVSEINKKNYNVAMKVYSDDIALEKQRINAIRDIANSYTLSRPRKTRYADLKDIDVDADEFRKNK